MGFWEWLFGVTPDEKAARERGRQKAAERARRNRRAADKYEAKSKGGVWFW